MLVIRTHHSVRIFAARITRSSEYIRTLQKVQISPHWQLCLAMYHTPRAHWRSKFMFVDVVLGIIKQPSYKYMCQTETYDRYQTANSNKPIIEALTGFLQPVLYSFEAFCPAYSLCDWLPQWNQQDRLCAVQENTRILVQSYRTLYIRLIP